jgi:hypothetical protein
MWYIAICTLFTCTVINEWHHYKTGHAFWDWRGGMGCLRQGWGCRPPDVSRGPLRLSKLVLERVSVSLLKAVFKAVIIIIIVVVIVRTDVHHIKQDTNQIPHIMAKLTRLRAIVATGNISPTTRGQNFILKQYLNNLTSLPRVFATTLYGIRKPVCTHRPRSPVDNSVVVKLLTRGIRDGDDLATLWRRVQELPLEMQALYLHILISIQQKYLQESS